MTAEKDVRKAIQLENSRIYRI